MSPQALPWPGLLAYASIRMPLALLELPLFVLLPILYNRGFGLELSAIGAVLFFARAADALADPAIGALLDRSRREFGFDRWVRLALPVLALAFALLLLPPVRGGWLLVWLAAASILAYFAYSVVSIAHQSWGAGLTNDAAQQARMTTVRESFGLVGVLLAIVMLSPEHTGKLAIAVAALTLVALIWSRRAPAPVHRPLSGDPRVEGSVVRERHPANASAPAHSLSLLSGWRRVRGNVNFRWLLAAFVFNGVATAVPATLVLFFASDVLRASTSESALFLGTYFLAAAVGMPLWLHLARRTGLRNTWLIGIVIAVIGFVWTLGLGEGDFLAFHIICAATGFALGSDLAMPPALLASVISEHGDRGEHEGAYFGIWNLATKFNLALAAGIALPLTGWLADNWAVSPAQSLSLIYAGLPSALKLTAGFVLMTAPLTTVAPKTPYAENLP